LLIKNVEHRVIDVVGNDPDNMAVSIPLTLRLRKWNVYPRRLAEGIDEDINRYAMF